MILRPSDEMGAIVLLVVAGILVLLTTVVFGVIEFMANHAIACIGLPLIAFSLLFTLLDLHRRRKANKP